MDSTLVASVQVSFGVSDSVVPLAGCDARPRACSGATFPPVAEVRYSNPLTSTEIALSSRYKADMACLILISDFCHTEKYCASFTFVLVSDHTTIAT